MNAQVRFDLPSGTMLGKYEILRKLATGGMAEIYLARPRGVAARRRTSRGLVIALFATAGIACSRATKRW